MKFYQLTRAQRLAALVNAGQLSDADAAFLAADTPLPAAVAASLTENQLGQFALPLGIARDLRVNGVTYQVPMVTEEPSVIAAASNGARLAALNGGVQATTTPHLVEGEIVFEHVADPVAAAKLVRARTAELMAVAAAAHPSIVRRGGGLQAVRVSTPGRFFKVTLVVAPQAAMGANIVNTIAEAVAATLTVWLAQPALVAILTNASAQLTTATVVLDPATLGTKTTDGSAIAARIAALSELATCDVARAVTHNKGIMNGIDAAILASGNDTRAVEAGVQAFAAASGQYQPLAQWHLTATGTLVGELKLPLQVGVVGGAISALPAAQVAQRLGGYKDVVTLQQVVAALGLVQNLAALRALVGPGIQAGHMTLQARALAIAVGAQGDEINRVAAGLATVPKDRAHAQAVLAALRKDETT
ncbi:hydroxymethylglutaryl-CoA reductase, degradative [Lacticaseibacillus daqingensis]|uniref:hydroxymethylglutaryl-CoA reductase, degradative n=1 Tax=Lacticaseibacillus daqingensis TaxID=2486014 RepID=UPI000F77CEFB|nr:hydroxymethylglutaryl-CoA reductase, degradative [Lacticaseibacillus daqingensis]